MTFGLLGAGVRCWVGDKLKTKVFEFDDDDEVRVIW